MPRKSAQRGRLLIGALIIGLVILLGAAWLWSQRHDIRRSFERATLPEPVEYQPSAKPLLPSSEPAALKNHVMSPKPTTADLSAEALVKAEANLAVPFTPQAPFGKWDPPYKEFCEEASVFMAASYLRNEDIPSPDFADQKMLAIKAFEEKRFGYYEDTTAAETAVILREYYKINQVKLLENPAVEDLKEAVAVGKLVIVPAAGRLLGNPYYTPPGPLYHMLVIKGYTADGKFITNDPGTRRGADFLFSEAVVMNAMHDWRPDGQIEQGRKVVLIVG